MFMNQYLVTEADHVCCLLITFLLYQRFDVYVIDFLHVVTNNLGFIFRY